MTDVWEVVAAVATSHTASFGTGKSHEYHSVTHRPSGRFYMDTKSVLAYSE
jgi:hypothetical protein